MLFYVFKWVIPEEFDKITENGCLHKRAEPCFLNEEDKEKIIGIIGEEIESQMKIL